MEKDILSMRIGQRLRHYRQQRQLSLDALAQLTGVSKPMLGQIERGVSNPTVATLWKIASGLQVPFTALVLDNPTLQLLRANEQTLVVEDDERFEAYITYTGQGVPLETYRVRLLPGCHRHAEPHGSGVIECITVTSGTLTVEIDGETYTLNKGDAVSFAADIGHVYRNLENIVCEISMAILYTTGSSAKSV